MTFKQSRVTLFNLRETAIKLNLLLFSIKDNLVDDIRGLKVQDIMKGTWITVLTFSIRKASSGFWLCIFLQVNKIILSRRFWKSSHSKDLSIKSRAANWYWKVKEGTLNESWRKQYWHRGHSCESALQLPSLF